jgi:hypothetical protein
MAWTVPRTASSDEIWASSDWNKYVRDNLLETFPGKAAAALEYPVATGLNAIAMRTAGSATVAISETTASTSYTNLTTNGPTVTKATGTAALVMWSARMSHSLANNWCRTSCDVTSATTIAANDEWSALVDGVGAGDLNRFGAFKLFTTLNAGSNVFTMKYKTQAATATFVDRHIIVVPL